MFVFVRRLVTYVLDVVLNNIHVDIEKPLWACVQEKWLPIKTNGMSVLQALQPSSTSGISSIEYQVNVKMRGILYAWEDKRKLFLFYLIKHLRLLKFSGLNPGRNYSFMLFGSHVWLLKIIKSLAYIYNINN